MIYRYDQSLKQPHTFRLTEDESKTMGSLRDNREIQQWLLDNTEYTYRLHGATIMFTSHEDATHFKMVWEGDLSDK